MQPQTAGVRQISIVVGTRPEVVKLAPVVHALRATSWARVRLVATAQHRELLDQLLGHFDLVPDRDLDCMQPEQDLSALTARMLGSLEAELTTHRPDLVLAQGDTATVFVAALAAFHRRLPFGHVEAGLRSGDRWSPFPEEMYRRLVAPLATLHFAPTDRAAAQLRAEGVSSASVFTTGNTVVDALRWTVESGRATPPPVGAGRRLVLVTAHRRENHGAPLRRICDALAQLVRAVPDIEILYPVHPNPAVRDAVTARLSGVARIRLCAPLDYAEFVGAMGRATLILTDSGGVQEEAPSVRVPVLVLRAETERPEAVAAGCARVVGTDAARIVEAASILLTDPAAHAAMAAPDNPFGDGQAARRICAAIAAYFDADSAATMGAP